MVTWAINTVSPQNFGLKWYAGRPRPEEVAFKIKNGEIARGSVMPELYDAIQAMDFGSATEFTAYPEGSPDHPSWPAMHSAASAGSLWIPVVMDLTPEQLCEVKAVDYAVSYARTVAGVHYRSDNLDGLNLGQAILARILPDYMQERYGSDPEAVRRKIESVRFDWYDYLDSSCFAV